jgi:hypothetical protein
VSTEDATGIDLLVAIRGIDDLSGAPADGDAFAEAECTLGLGMPVGILLFVSTLPSHI